MLGWRLFPEWLTVGGWVPPDRSLSSRHVTEAYRAACDVATTPTAVEARLRLKTHAPSLFNAFMAKR